MWNNKQPSPASSTSTVDQQEITFDDNQTHPDYQTPTINLNATNASPFISLPGASQTTSNTTTPTAAPTTTTIPTTNKRNSTACRANKRVTGTVCGRGQSNIKCSPPKKPKLYQSSHQVAPWKSLQHHFLRYSDIKFRPEKRMTMAELGNEVLQRRNGWKVHHLVGQLSDLIQNETQTREKVRTLMNVFVEDGAKKVHDLANNCHKLPEQYATLLKSQRSYGKNEFKPELIVTKLDDLLRGDIQRSNMFDGQLRDCRDLIVSITNEHRDRVVRLTTKFNKRIQL